MTKSRLPSQLEHLLVKTLQHYNNASPSVKSLIHMTNLIQGRCGHLLFQSSHGTQQIKLYEPEKYKNAVNTPLRVRTRILMKLAWESSPTDIGETLQTFYHQYPYYLLQDEPINLRLKNFYFDNMPRINETLQIYKALDYKHLNPEKDELYREVSYSPKKTVTFHFQNETNEQYYGVIKRTGQLSTIVLFNWLEGDINTIIDAYRNSISSDHYPNTNSQLITT